MGQSDQYLIAKQGAVLPVDLPKTLDIEKLEADGLVEGARPHANGGRVQSAAQAGKRSVPESFRALSRRC